jgi:N utilization substance protein A
MATKRKSKKKTKPKKSVISKASSKIRAATKKLAARKAPSKHSPVRRKSNARAKAKPGAGKIIGRNLESAPPNPGLGKREDIEALEITHAGTGPEAAGQSGDIQGLSDLELADSESVDELIEEGNAFEAEVVKGVEDAPNADEGEIRVHERPEDDLPDEGEM